MEPTVPPKRRRVLSAAIAIGLVALAAAAIPLVSSLRERRAEKEAEQDRISAENDLARIYFAQECFHEGKIASWVRQQYFPKSGKERPGAHRYAPSLAALAEAGFIDADLASGTRRGYTFRILSADEGSFSLTVSPDERHQRLGCPWHYFVDESGVVRGSNTRPATSLDNPCGDTVSGGRPYR